MEVYNLVICFLWSGHKLSAFLNFVSFVYNVSFCFWLILRLFSSSFVLENFTLMYLGTVFFLVYISCAWGLLNILKETFFWNISSRAPPPLWDIPMTYMFHYLACPMAHRCSFDLKKFFFYLCFLHLTLAKRLKAIMSVLY